MKEKANLRDIIAFGGAIMAFMIGAGFASGQEILQFFTHFGFWGSMGSGLIAMIVFTWFSATILEDGRKLQDPNAIFVHYCGNTIGKFFEWFVPSLMFLVLSIMISGAGAIVLEYYGLNPNVGRIGMAIITLGTVLLGLKKLVRIIGYLGPVIVVFTIGIGIVSITQNPEGVAASGEILKSIDVPSAHSSWIFSGLLYGAFAVVGLMPFIAGIGKQAKSRTDTMLGGLFGGVAFMLGALLLNIGMLANIDRVYDKQIPSLVVASEIFPFVGSIFAVLLLVGIYTSAVPMLWTVSNRISTNENSIKYKITAVVIVIISFFSGQLQFSQMVGIVYPFTGYMGFILFAGMIYTKYF